jgi:hypothetical protein
LTLLNLETVYHFAAVDKLFFGYAINLFLNPAVVFGVEQVEVNGLRRGCREGLVKEAVLEVPGLGRSSPSVEGGVQWFMDSPGIKPARGWSAKRLQGDSYTVSFDFFNGEAGEEQAIWGANLATTEVRYINKNAKSFSWLPKD